MTETATGLLQLLLALKRAAEAEFQGNRYYLIANEISALAELVPAGAVNSASDSPAPDFASALGALRKGIEAELTGNSYYNAANGLAALERFLPASPQPADAEAATPAAAATQAPSVPAERPAEPSPIKTVAPAAVAQATDVGKPAEALEVLALDGAHSGPTFNDLAAASQARVHESMESLGLHAVRHQTTAPIPAEAPETLADGELERRSSEPCAMAELGPVEVEPVAAAAISAEIPAAAVEPEHPADLGLQTAQSETSAAEGALAAASPEGVTEAGLQTAAPGYDRPAGPASETVVPIEDAGIKAKKTLFNIWLDLMFGRKS